jgi:hypothetical protein
MILNENTLVSDELKSVYFCCDLQACKGACCIEGDAGAPLDEEEISLLEDHIDDIKPFMRKEGIAEVEDMGVFDYDAEGKFVTPLVKGRECVYVYFEEEITRCAIEKAFSEKKIPFQKPISCHLYPIRIKETAAYDTVNYHRWPICKKALENGFNQKIPLYAFAQDSLIRKYGRSWYNKLLSLLY